METGLETYRRRRKPGRTPEPFGSTPGTGPPRFVVQRHAARRLHYDFRLELDGALASWAVPKGVPLEPGARSLAVHVEDHPLEYADFEGRIPAGQYGAGTVEIWDAGTYELLERADDGKLTVLLHGRRLEGTWTLVPARLDGKEENWLLIRRRADDGPARRAYRPMLASAADSVPHGSGWRYEVKLDGYRALAYLRGGDCTLVSRSGNDLTERFGSVARALAQAVRSPDAVLDGEVCRIGDEGRASFSELQRGSGALVYFAFDLLERDGSALVDLPLDERRRLLRELLETGPSVGYSEAFADGDALYEVAAQRGLEGIVAKRGDSPYREGRRSADWVKVKTARSDEFVVAGYTRGSGRRAGTFGALVLGAYDGVRLRHVGNVGSGFRDDDLESLLGVLEPLRRPTSPFDPPPKLPRVRAADVVWVEPRVVVQVRYSEWTHDGHLRQPTYLGVRDDKDAREVTTESGACANLAQASPALTVLRHGRRELRLSNLDKLFWPGEGITKGDLIDYYRAVAPTLLPHVRGRPFTMRRYPDGAFGKAFFQKNLPAHAPDWLPRFHDEVTPRSAGGKTRPVDFPVIDDELSLLWLVNMGCIDLNTWYSRIDRPDRPDFVLFDLDPTPDVPWRETIEVARILGALLDRLGLVSFPKTSGGKGFHVLVPLDRRSTYDDTRDFAAHVAGAIARTHPKLATTRWSKSLRRGVLIDANQNGEGKTIASAYSVRPHPGAPVSTPLLWKEVDEHLDPSAFTMTAVLERARALGDVHADLLSTRQSLSKALKKLG